MKDDQTGRRSISRESSERLDLQLNTMNIDSDLNESESSKSNQGDTIDNTNADSSVPTTNVRSSAATPAILMTVTSRTSTSTNIGQASSRAVLHHLASIVERRRSPDLLLKRWKKGQKLIGKKLDEAFPLSVSG